MKLRDAVAIFGAFCMAFGGTLKSRGETKFTWWLGEAMTTLGPILMASRAFTGSKEKEPASDTNTTTT